MREHHAWVVAAWVVSAGLAQGQVLNPPPRDVINQSRPLMDAEVVTVLEAARRAVEGRTFRLSYTPTGPGADIQINDAAFDMLQGRRPLTSGPVERSGDRTLRALVAPYQGPEGALGGPPPGTLMSLWLDTDSLLPVRWSLKLPASAERGIPAGAPDFAVWFTYLNGVNLEPPTDVPAPACIS